MPGPPDLALEELLRRLVEARVDFVVVGGVAVNVHGYGRFTKDLDIAYAPDKENLARLGTLLAALHARLVGIDEEVPFVADARTLSQTEMLTLDTDLGRLDLLRRPAGAPGHVALRTAALAVELDGVVVPVAGLDHLLAMKRAAGRPQDLLDVAALERARELEAEEGSP